MLSLVKVENPAPCEGCDGAHRARNHIFLCGHSYMMLCHDCLMEHAQIAIDNASSSSVNKELLADMSQPKMAKAA